MGKYSHAQEKAFGSKWTCKRHTGECSRLDNYDGTTKEGLGFVGMKIYYEKIHDIVSMEKIGN